MGDVQAELAAPSSEQVNVASLSVSEKEIDAEVAFVGLTGPVPIVGTGGGVLSTVHVRLAPELTFPAESTAVTTNECWPLESAEYAFGDLHDEAVAPSSAQSKVTPLCESLKEKLTEGPVVPVGPDEIVGWGGGIVSTVQVRETAEPVPLSVVARTENVCEPWANPVYVFGDVHAAYAEPSRRHENDAPD